MTSYVEYLLNFYDVGIGERQPPWKTKFLTFIVDLFYRISTFRILKINVFPVK